MPDDKTDVTPRDLFAPRLLGAAGVLSAQKLQVPIHQR